MNCILALGISFSFCYSNVTKYYNVSLRLPSVLCHCWLSSRKGIWPVKNGGWWRWAHISPDGVAPIRMVGVSASVNLPLHHNVQRFSSGTGSSGWSQKNGRKMIVVVVVFTISYNWYSLQFCFSCISDVDECLEGSPCTLPHQKCINIPGSFKCGCEDGFVASSNGSCQLRPKGIYILHCCVSVSC